MTTHTVKSWAHFFDAIRDGRKLHDLRIMDRDYKVGDFMILQKYDNINGRYTGDELKVEITYITSDKVPCAFSSSALAKDYAILSIKPIYHIDPSEVFTYRPEDFRIFFPTIPVKNELRRLG